MPCISVLVLSILISSGGYLYAEATFCSPRDGSNTKIYHIPENSANGTLIGNLALNGDASSTINLSFVEPYLEIPNQCGANGKNCNSWLNLVQSTQDLTLFLKEVETLDRDGPLGVTRIDVNVVCTVLTGSDAGSQENIFVIVFVDDVNDNDPTFENDHVTVTLNELTPVGTKILTLTAFDVDENSNITYRISTETTSGFFTIFPPSSGDVVLANELDYEEMKSTSVEITLLVEAVEDAPDGRRVATTTVEIRVIDGDDQAPVFTSCELIDNSCATTLYTAHILTTSTPTTTLSNLMPDEILAYDPDVDLTDPTQISYSLHGDPQNEPDFSAFFAINETTGVVHLQNQLPMNISTREITLYVKATQDNDDSQFAFAKLLVTLVDTLEDFFPPEIRSVNMTGYINPQEGVIAFVRDHDGSMLQLVASDEDYVGTSILPHLEFQMVNQQTLFEITNTGHILFNTLAQGSSSSLHTIQIQAVNVDALSKDTRTSDVVILTVEASARNAVCNVHGCDNEDASVGLIAGIATTAVILVIAILIIIFLVFVVMKYRRNATRRQSLEGFQNHTANKLSESLSNEKRGAFVVRNRLSGDYLDSNNKSSNNLNENSHTSSQNGDKSSRYLVNHRKGGISRHEDAPSIAPYDSFSAVDSSNSSPHSSWEHFELKESIQYHQLSVEQDSLHSSPKSQHQGFLTLHNGNIMKCFIKIYPESHQDKGNLTRDFVAMTEVLNFRSCTQINLVKFYGTCFHLGSLYAVSEFIPSTNNLRTALRKSRLVDHASEISSFSGSQLSTFALAIGDGLRYLHGHSVAHGNICSSQIILTDQMVPKISGCCGKGNPRLRKHGLLRWTAPEFAINREFSFASDVWSYAVTVWEIATLGGQPYPSVSQKGMKQHLLSLRNGEPPLPMCRNMARRLWTVLQSCLQIKLSDRPTIAEVYKRLLKIMEITTPITVSRPAEYEFAPTAVLQKKY